MIGLVVIVIEAIVTIHGWIVSLVCFLTGLVIVGDELTWNPCVGIAEPHTIMLNALVIVDMRHTPITIHEHEAIVTDEVSNHCEEAVVMHKRWTVMHRLGQIVFDEVPSIGLGCVCLIACMQYAVVHHSDIACDDIIGMAILHVCVAMSRPTEVDSQLTIVIGQAIDKRTRLGNALG